MELEELVKKITEADSAYYTDGSSSISDLEYDTLKQALRDMAPEHPLLKSLGNDHVVGFGTVRRAVAMLSLEKIQQNKESPTDLSALLSWINGVSGIGKVIVEPKVDGMSAEVKYEYGKRTVVSTRGEGYSGDNITHTTAQCFPEFIPAWQDEEEINIRGELYISKEEYERINAQQTAKGEPIFANARNLCAGTVKSKEVLSDRKISFIAHGFGYTTKPLGTFKSLYSELESFGIPTVPFAIPASTEELSEVILSYPDKQETLDYCIDGVVVKVNDIQTFLETGETSHHPRGAVAFKFIPDAKETTVLDIIWQIGGKTGRAVPVAVIEPLTLAGSIVERVSLANAGLMSHRGIKVGSRVVVERSNEIIPHVVHVLDASPYELEPSAICPYCGSVMELRQGKTEHTADYVCDNPDCSARKTALLHAALGSGGLNILGIGPEICAAFVEQYPDINAAKLLQLLPDEYPQRMSELQRSNLYAEARTARRAPLWRWITAMMIPGVGESTAKAISKSYKNLRAWLTELREGTLTPADVTAKRWDACRSYVATDGNMALELIEMSLNPESDNYVEVMDNPPLEGMSFVVTGTFSYGRKAIEDMIPRFGGTLKSSVSKKTNYVVCGEAPGASKINKATSLEIPIITEDELFAMIQENQHDN